MASEGELQGVAKLYYGATCATYHFLHIGSFTYAALVGHLQDVWSLGT